MRFARLIAGPNDGRIEKVDADQMQVVVHSRKPIAASISRKSMEPMGSMINNVIYTRRCVRTASGEIVYFAPDFMSDLEALAHVLGP